MKSHDILIDWDALVDEFKNNENIISMVDFCKQKNVSIKNMKRHYYRSQPASSQKAIDIKSAHCSNRKELILIEYNGFKLRVSPGFDEQFLKSVIRCIVHDS